MSTYNLNTFTSPNNYSTTLPHPDRFGSASLSENLSYGMITPQYSPETTVAITLRHFEKEAKSQAEREYDDENGALPPPPSEDDLSIDPDSRKAHKKKRKVRSAIVSRRKTNVYLEKLETELETRDGMNSTLANNVELYRDVLADVKAKICAMQRSVGQKPSKRMRSHYRLESSSSRKIKKSRRSHKNHQTEGRYMHFHPQQNQQSHHYGKRHQHQHQENCYNQQPLNCSSTDQRYGDFQQQQNSSSNHYTSLAPIDQSASSHVYNSAFSPIRHQSSNNNQDNFLENSQNTTADLYSTISAEEIGDTSIPITYPQELNSKQSEAAFSDCSDRNVSPVSRATTSSETFETQSNLEMFSAAQMHSWKQSLHLNQNAMTM